MHTNDTAGQSQADEIQTADVVVVGARCAGAATAMLLAANGHDVVVVDRDTFPSDTLSTHAIARSGVVQLHRWGLLDTVVDSGAPGIRKVAFHSATGTVVRTIKDRYGVDFLVAPRRRGHDPILQDAAVANGARLVTGVTVKGVRRSDDGRVTGVWGTGPDGPVEIAAQYVVGADGLRSQVARAVGAPIVEDRPSDGAIHYAYFTGDFRQLEYHLGEGTFAGVFPTHHDAACIWVCAPRAWMLTRRRGHDSVDEAFRTMLQEAAPALAHRVAEEATPAGTVHGLMQMPNQIRHPVGDGWALVGDAGYFRDAITGHGISDAFRDAELLPRHSTRRCATGATAPLPSPGTTHAATRCSARSSSSPASCRPSRPSSSSSSCRSN